MWAEAKFQAFRGHCPRPQPLSERLLGLQEASASPSGALSLSGLPILMTSALPSLLLEPPLEQGWGVPWLRLRSPPVSFSQWPWLRHSHQAAPWERCCVHGPRPRSWHLSCVTRGPRYPEPGEKRPHLLGDGGQIGFPC